MADNSVQSIGRMESDLRSQEINQMFQNHDARDAASVNRAAAQPRAEKVEENAAEARKPAAQADILLKFRVDEKTNDITVFVIDRASKQVVRTIPPDEVTKLRAGDLIKLLA